MDVLSRFRTTFRSVIALLLVTFLLSMVPLTTSAAAQTTAQPAVTISTSVNPNGSYTITFPSPAWTFGGNVGHTLTNIATQTGSDALGSYTETSFQYQAGVARSSSIRTYDARSIALFSTTYLAASSNSEPFPVLSTFPQNPYHLSYKGSFGFYGMNLAGADSPWLFFDAHANSFLLSPAANFVQARTVQNSNGSIASGINSGVTSLPKNFTHKTMLAVGTGINSVYTTWGQAMTDLQGKVRPANDADVSLNTLGYWTDHGATYYYNFDSSKGYAGTLQAVKNDFNSKGIPLGYMQLDSWWYPKSSNDTWQGGSSNSRGGEYTYTADKTLFPNGLASFQQSLGLPLITHARWIDTASPYRSQYTMSNNVSIDPKFWSSIMSSIKNAGVITYEQDWLSADASANSNNLNDPNAFLSDMASAASANGLNIQYCMTLPGDYLQSTMYNNLTTMRVSDDRFQQNRWDTFLYDSRLSSAVGVWPWSDVFMSTETDNLLLSTLSAGMVGVGDAIGTESKTNLMQTIRPDGVIVKPDTSIVPTDETYVAEAQGSSKPAMVAYALTNHTSLSEAYVFAYNRGSGTTQTATFTPNKLGIAGQSYVYNYFTGQGQLVNAGQNFSDTVGSGSYYVVAPVGQSGIAFLGDANKFVSTGHKRISRLSDNGTVQADVAFASGEGAVTLHGYAPAKPTVSASNGSVGIVSYDPSSHLFNVPVTAGSGNTASITITPGSTSPATIYEAENATLSGPLALHDNPGYSGTGYADYQHNSNDYVQWSVNAASAGTSTLTFRYANGALTDRPLAISVNGITVNGSFSFPPTGSWSKWNTVSLTTSLHAGTNTIRTTAIGQNGGNIDYLAVGG